MPYGMMLDIWGDIGNFLSGVFSIIPKLMYFIISCVMSLIDLCQVAFRKLAGLDPIMISNEVYTGDSVYKLITDALFTGRYPAIRTVFWALIILGIFMLFITSIVAVAKVEYAPDKDKGNSKAGVVKNFLKALFSFAIIPCACLFGMWLSNSLIGVIDTATAFSSTPESTITTYYDKWSGSDSTADTNNELLNSRESSYYAYNIFGLRIPTTSEPFSASIFRACAYGCNRIRTNDNYFLELSEAETLGILQNFDNKEEAANVIDTGFAINAKLKGTFNLNTSISDKYFSDWSEWISFDGWNYSGITELSKYNVNAVFYFYNLWSFNYIVGYVAVMSIGKSFYTFVLFLMQRLFEIAGLFVLSPIATALMPLDNGEALKQWRQTFVTKFALMLIMVLSLNLVTPLLAIAQNIKMFGVPIVDYLITTFFLIACLNAVSSMNAMLTKIFTGDVKNWDQVGNAATQITSNFNSGVRATASTARLASTPVTLGGRIAGATARAAYNAPTRSRERNERHERTEIQEQIRFGNRADGDFTDAEIQGRWGGLAGAGSAGSTGSAGADDARGINTVNSFLNTAEGQNFINTYYGGSRTSAQRALRGTYGQDVTDVNAQREYQQFVHDREQFARSTQGQALIGAGNGPGTVAYESAMANYHSQSFEDKTNAFVGANLTARQTRFHNAANRAAAWENSAGRRAVRAVGTGAGRVAGAVAPYARRVGNAAQRLYNPIRNIMGSLPFTQLFTDATNSARNGFGNNRGGNP